MIRRLIERYESWRYRRTYGRNADHSRAIAAARKARATTGGSYFDTVRRMTDDPEILIAVDKAEADERRRTNSPSVPVDDDKAVG